MNPKVSFAKMALYSRVLVSGNSTTWSRLNALRICRRQGYRTMATPTRVFQMHVRSRLGSSEALLRFDDRQR